MKNKQPGIQSYTPPTVEIIDIAPEQAILQGSSSNGSGSLNSLTYENLEDNYWDSSTNY